MYFTHITLLSVLCVISEQSIFHKNHQGITDITVHTIPGATTVARFQFNSISFVPANFFVNLPSLLEIWLGENVITDIDNSTFSAVPTVTLIALHSNQLTVIREMMFSGLPNLGTLWLTHNAIHTVELGCFKDNTALTLLDVYDNYLQNLPRGMFGFDNHPTNLNEFKMQTNPLQCDQDLCWLKQVDTTWITVTHASLTECAGPAALAGRKWDTLTEMELCLIQGKCLT